jgi:hypothetical protein
MEHDLTLSTSEPQAADKFNMALSIVRQRMCIATTALNAVQGEIGSELALRLASTSPESEESDGHLYLPCKKGDCGAIFGMDSTAIIPVNCPLYQADTVL